MGNFIIGMYMLEIEVFFDGDEKWIFNNCVNLNVVKIYSSMWLSILMECISYVVSIGYYVKCFLFNVVI